MVRVVDPLGPGLKPLPGLANPYTPDSGFDSTFRIPSAAPKPMPPLPPATGGLAAIASPPPTTLASIAGAGPAPAAAPISSTPAPAQAPTPPPPAPPPATPPAAVPPAAQPPAAAAATTGPPATLATVNKPTEANLQAINNFLDQTGIHLPKDWMQQLGSDPEGFISWLRSQGTVSQTRHDTPYGNFTRAADYLQSLLGGTKPNPEYGIQQAQQKLYDTSLQRLGQESAYGGRQSEEELLASLESRGLLHSGIGAREIERFREAKMQNFNEASSRLNELILSGDISRLSAQELAKLSSDLGLRNQESLLRLQAQLEKEAQPDPWAQILGGTLGTALPFLLGPKKPNVVGPYAVDPDQPNVTGR